LQQRFHELCRFEVWLAGVNKEIQAEYWLIPQKAVEQISTCRQYPGAGAINKHILIEDQDLDALSILMHTLQKGTPYFINHKPRLFQIII